MPSSSIANVHEGGECALFFLVKPLGLCTKWVIRGDLMSACSSAAQLSLWGWFNIYGESTLR